MDFLPYTHEYMLVVSIMSGMFLGFIWDIYRLFRHYIKLGKIGTALGDLAYWIISVYISIEIIFDISLGDIRMFILLGFVFGAFLYFYGISKYILWIFIFCIDTIVNIINKIFGLLVYPVMFLKKKLLEFLHPYGIKIKNEVKERKRKYKFFKCRIKKLFKDKKILYNKKKKSKKKKGKKRVVKKGV